MCKHSNKCKLYNKESDTCNYCPDIDNHCGKFRELVKKK